MDKLKPILAQKFWILSGLSLVLALVGWFMSKGSLQAAIDTRRTALKSAFDSVKASGENPNDKWTQQLKTQNDLLEKELRVAYEQLYLRQQELKFWPAGISAEAQADPLKATQTDLEVYRARYPEHVEDVRMYIEPANEIEGFGKVHFPTERMERRDWGALPPTPKQMQESQEDLWLYANVFQAIAEINRAASSQTDATLREVVELKLRGGDPEKIGQTASAGGFAGGAEAGGMPEAFGAAGMMGAGGGQSGGGAAALGGGKVDFSADDEFGPDGSGGAAGGGMPDMGSMAGMMAGGAEGGMQPEAAAEVKRYVRETDQWKTRGFYMKAVIDHRKLPDVLAGLTSAKWPIRITRVHQVDLLPDDLVDAGATGGAGPMSGMAAGMPAGGPGGGGMGAGASGPPQITGLNMLTPSSPGGAGAAPGVGLGSGFGSAAPAAAAFAPAAEGNPMGVSGTETVDTYQAAMNDPDLVVIAIDGLIVMYNPPPADPNAPAATEPAAESAAPPASVDPAAAASVGATPAETPAATPPSAPAAEPAATPEAAPGETTPPATPPAATDEATTDGAAPAAAPEAGAPAPAAPAGAPAPAAPATGTAPPPEKS